MAEAALKMRRAGAEITAAALKRLTRFPAIRKAISTALDKAPAEVSIPADGRFVHFTVRPVRRGGRYLWEKDLFSVIPLGHEGTKAVIGTLKSEVKKPSEFRRFKSRMGAGLARQARRSLIYQMRQAGIIGGSRIQAILVPKARVQAAVARFMGRPAYRRAVGANPRVYHLGEAHDFPGSIGIHSMRRGRMRLQYEARGRRAYHSVRTPFAQAYDPKRKPSRNPILATLGINPNPAPNVTRRHKASSSEAWTEGKKHYFALTQHAGVGRIGTAEKHANKIARIIERAEFYCGESAIVRRLRALLTKGRQALGKARRKDRKTLSNPSLSFEAWMQEVDNAVSRRTGMSVHDLPDVPFRDWYDDGVPPRSAAARAIRAANENPRGRCAPGKVLSRRGKCVTPIGYRAKKGKLYGWHARSSAASRHASLKKSIRAAGWSTTRHRLRFLVNISHDNFVRQVARQDIAWLKENRASLERPRRVAANDPISAILGGVAYGVTGHMLRKNAGKKPRRPSAHRNAATEGTAINIPFRDGAKVTPAAVRNWLSSLPNSRMKGILVRRFEQNMRQYRKFHLGAEPEKFTYKNIPMGAQKGVTDVDFVTSEGKEWAASYQVPKHSRKYDPSVEGRYIHSHGESGVEVDIARPAKRARLPERFHTADGKFVGVLPSRNVKITDWYRG